ncbi:uncharacterized protein BDR25DRAFT_357519 [Lindgomyces ingoldianus]|uniref:Uncharacterized protein n=1 Tax=Lindgomyces ingoldianus TaxID=673940 RepID=A0ACB6QR70_9PLEO|nr:uncharacterized protein BDR25DRAFT_357519 [Lindgomyces ingoldianus]KAF2468590.1 hypothetical protein BDR25DRAFT_357519 [Lindgomyces ingoldianus]
MNARLRYGLLKELHLLYTHTLRIARYTISCKSLQLTNATLYVLLTPGSKKRMDYYFMEEHKLQWRDHNSYDHLYPDRAPHKSMAIHRVLRIDLVYDADQREQALLNGASLAFCRSESTDYRRELSFLLGETPLYGFVWLHALISDILIILARGIEKILEQGPLAQVDSEAARFFLYTAIAFTIFIALPTQVLPVAEHRGSSLYPTVKDTKLTTARMAHNACVSFEKNGIKRVLLREKPRRRKGKTMEQRSIMYYPLSSSEELSENSTQTKIACTEFYVYIFRPVVHLDLYPLLVTWTYTYVHHL